MHYENSPMEIKKTPKANLEEERLLFFLMGFAVVLSVFFVLLEWQSSAISDYDWTSLGPVFVEKEFEGGNRVEETVPALPPEATEPEIVYEDYIITDDVSIIEIQEDTLIDETDIEEDEFPIFQIKNETVAPVDIQANAMEAATAADIMPQFPGGQPALFRYIYENVQYPSVALKQRIEGRVWCSFIVEPDGSVSNVHLEESVYIFLDEEAIRVLKNMPDWLPGKTNGENIRVKVYIPIVFKR